MMYVMMEEASLDLKYVDKETKKLCNYHIIDLYDVNIIHRNMSN